jgi:hypothetical protein
MHLHLDRWYTKFADLAEQRHATDRRLLIMEQQIQELADMVVTLLIGPVDTDAIREDTEVAQLDTIRTAGQTEINRHRATHRRPA